MKLEHQRREKLKAMDEKKRLEAEEQFRKLQDSQRHHEKLRHPASKDQLEEVWEKDDGLKREEFDAKTFFFLHGMPNSLLVLSYDPSNPTYM